MRLLTLLTSTLCALTACELPSKLGDLPDDTSAGSSDTSGGGDSDASTTATGGKTSTSDETTGEPQTTGPQTTGEPDTTTTGPVTGAESTGQGGPCEGLDEQACQAEPGCMTYHGVAYEFEGCQPGDAYLGCGPTLECDQAFTAVCRDGTDEVYLAPIACLPPGFSECDVIGKIPCGESCDLLDESACADEDDFCNPIYGQPYVEQNGTICVDQDQQFIACVVMDGVCPPFIPTVCNDDDPADKYDIPSGCIPPNFSECDPGGAKPCN